VCGGRGHDHSGGDWRRCLLVVGSRASLSGDWVGGCPAGCGSRGTVSSSGDWVGEVSAGVGQSTVLE
jgi:hypothetical protein